MWDVTPTTTLRLAAFRALKRSLIADQTVEPTQVAGFNQFFDDPTATESRRYGIAIDQKFSSNLYGGLEVAKRDLRVPVFLQEAGKTVIVNWEEEAYRAYLNWVPHPRFAVSMGYQLEKFDGEEQITGTQDTTTHLAPIALRYFHPSGLFSRLGTTYVNQTVEDTGDDEFVLVDFAIGYRLPKRLGILKLLINNLFDKDFKFQGLDLRTLEEESPLFLPERTIAAQITLAF
jgi:hypothetical protein